MNSIYDYINIAVSLAAAVALSFAVMPAVIWLSKKIGAIDVPLDGRRMHDHPIPRLGGLAIIFAFIITCLIVLRDNKYYLQILPGSVIIGILGVLDDKYRLPAWPKFFVQCIAAGVAVAGGVSIQGIKSMTLIHLPDIRFGVFVIPITILWIVGITNAVNLIDGLDGLAAGVSTIASLSLVLASVIKAEMPIAVIAAALAGGCIGVLPYNKNPAKIFIGDTGATFLGYVLAVLSIQGPFKYYTAISFFVPFLILGLPIFDTAMAIIRRVIHKKSPFSPDRSHLHHKLIDMGLSQKQAVATLYSVSTILGIVAVMFTYDGGRKCWIWFFVGVAAIFLIYRFIIYFSRKNMHNPLEQPTESKPGGGEKKDG